MCIEPARIWETLTAPTPPADPYPAYAAMRKASPVWWTGDSWLLTRYADVAAVLKDDRFSSRRVPMMVSRMIAAHEKTGEPWQGLYRSFARQMIFLDAAPHRRLKSLVAPALTGPALKELGEWVAGHVEELLDQVKAEGSLEIMSALARPLPLATNSRLLGLPVHDELGSDADQATGFFGILGRDLTGEEYRRILAGLDRLTAYLRPLVALPASETAPGLLRRLKEAEPRLARAALLANCFFLFQAGQQTTTGLIGNGLAALLANPKEQERLRAEPALIGNAVEELLRYDSPVQFTSRIARESVAVGEKRLERGQHVILAIGAANRDPEQFADPDRLDLGRTGRHLAFAGGAHFCLGAALGRLQGQAAIAALLRRHSSLSLARDGCQWRAHPVLRRPDALWVRP